MDKPRYLNRANFKHFSIHFRVLQINFDTFLKLHKKQCLFPDKNVKPFWVDTESERWIIPCVEYVSIRLSVELCLA